MGVTGARDSVSDAARTLVARTREARPDIALCVGLGVSDGAQAAEIAASDAPLAPDAPAPNDATEHLDVHLIVVMGHEGCGAVSSAMLPDEALAATCPLLAAAHEACQDRPGAQAGTEAGAGLDTGARA